MRPASTAKTPLIQKSPKRYAPTTPARSTHTSQREGFSGAACAARARSAVVVRPAQTRCAATRQTSPTTSSSTARASDVPCEPPLPERPRPAATIPAITATEQIDPSAKARSELGPPRLSRKIAGTSAVGDSALTSASATRFSQAAPLTSGGPGSGSRAAQLLAGVGLRERVGQLALRVELLQARERRGELGSHRRQRRLDRLRGGDDALYALRALDLVLQLLLVLVELARELVERVLRLGPGLRVRLAEPLQAAGEVVGRRGDVVLRVLQAVERRIRLQLRRARLQRVGPRGHGRAEVARPVLRGRLALAAAASGRGDGEKRDGYDGEAPHASTVRGARAGVITPFGRSPGREPLVGWRSGADAPDRGRLHERRRGRERLGGRARPR